MQSLPSILVELRDQCGEDWLRSGAGDNTLLGIQEVEGEKDMVVSEGSKSWSRRSSDVVPDAIEQSDVVMREEEKD